MAAETARSGTLLERVALARDRRLTALAECDAAQEAFCEALRDAKRAHSWTELATVTGLTRSGVRYLTLEDPWRQKP